MLPFLLPLGLWDGVSGGIIVLNKEGLGFTTIETKAFTFRDGKMEFTLEPGQMGFTFNNDDPP